ncbi:hypothetical protein Taro_055737 [Colocasia esculenta]|uniref:Uncharacterized protein n=1 Tax=Colocasia esculenta TaxID=4460 RepID=A0A843XUE9_COLES|nr:hypothetical protein [Colocasia esculenta]
MAIPHANVLALQEQVRSGDATATEYFELGAVMLRRKFYPAAIKYLQQAIEKWDGDDQDLAQVLYFQLATSTCDCFYSMRRLKAVGVGDFITEKLQPMRSSSLPLSLTFANFTVYNALGVSYVRDNKLEKGILQFENAVKLQPGYVTAWNNLGDAYEKKKDLAAALKAFEEVLLFDPNNKIARPRRDVLRDRVALYKGVPIKSEDRR